MREITHQINPEEVLLDKLCKKLKPLVKNDKIDKVVAVCDWYALQKKYFNFTKISQKEFNKIKPFLREIKV